MHHSAIVSIDLGSAYAKIGIRRGWNEQTDLVRGLPVALPPEEEYCIPSVVTRVASSRGERWLIGSAAAEQLPGESVRIYRNWKAALFRTTPGSLPEDEKANHDEAVAVASIFFARVRASLTDQGLLEGRSLPVRVAVPKLKGGADVDELIRDILGRAGWASAMLRPTTFEPESNAIGVLSRGRNETWLPPQRSFCPPSTRTIRMQRMLEPGLSTAFRGMRDHYTVLVTDIGAFTTDFGLVRVDTSLSNDDWNRPVITQESIELGMRELDDTVLDLLEPEVKHYLSKRPAIEWERRKQELYAGRPQRIVISGTSMTIGEDIEAEAIQEEIRRFAKRVSKARDAFLREHGMTTVHEEAITGGGSALTALRSVLLDSIRAAKRHVHDLWDPKEPDVAVRNGAGPMTVREKELRSLLNRALIRGGSAIGGASVFFE